MPALIRNRQFKAIGESLLYQSNWTGWVAAPSRTLQYGDYWENRSGFTNPGWRSQVKAGVQAATSYTFDSQRIVNVQGGTVSLVTGTVVNGVLQWTQYQHVRSDAGVAYNVYHLTMDTVKVDNQALTQLYRRIAEQYEHMNSLVTLGEGREAVRQLRKPYAAVQAGISAYADGAIVRIKNLPNFSSKVKRVIAVKKALADTWLETSFGLMPTLSDVAAAAETLARLYEAPPRRSRVSGRKEGESREINTYTGLSVTPTIYYTQVNDTVTKLSVAYRVGLRERTYSDFVGWERLKDLAGFRLGNFIPTIYELIPYSWLVDYVTNLGEALTANQVDTSDVIWAVRSEITRTTLQVHRNVDFVTTRNATPNLVSLTGSSLGQTSVQRINSSRALILPTALPSVIPTVRSLSEAYKPQRVANVLAVVLGKTGKLERALAHYIRDVRNLPSTK